MERQNSEVVRFELAPPEFDSNYSQIVRALLSTAPPQELIALIVCAHPYCART